jgi:hypothetical protein
LINLSGVYHHDATAATAEWAAGRQPVWQTERTSVALIPARRAASIPSLLSSKTMHLSASSFEKEVRGWFPSASYILNRDDRVEEVEQAGGTQRRLNNFTRSPRRDCKRNFTPVPARDISDDRYFLNGGEAFFVSAHEKFGCLRWIKRNLKLMLKLAQNLVLRKADPSDKPCPRHTDALASNDLV